MKPQHLSGIYKIRDALLKAKGIPNEYRKHLQERLPIFCNDYTRERSAERHTNQEYKRRQRDRKAHNVYNGVYENDPLIILPFMIHISPAACREFDVLQFCREHKRCGISLGNYAKEFLEITASRTGIETSDRFRDLLKRHYPRDPLQSQAPLTSEKWGFNQLPLDFIRDKFGESILQALERSPIRGLETSQGAKKLTSCAKIKFPEWPGQDALVWFDIGMVAEIASILYPRASPDALPVLATGSMKETSTQGTSAYQSQGDSTPIINIHRLVTLKGACINAVSSFFSQIVCDAIDASQLRLWERDHQIFDTTDCVILQVWSNSPCRGIICLRIEFKLAMKILNSDIA